MNKEKEEGYDAFLEGKSDTDNPYDESSNEYLSWNDGYMEAEDDENPII